MNPTVQKLLKAAKDEWVIFFVFFSRFEFSMKKVGLTLSDGNQIFADWGKKFCDELGTQFFEEIKASGRIDTLIRKPPKRQIGATGGDVDWRDGERVRNTQQLFEAVRQIRNNLFHGGKYPYGPMDDDSRNQQLLTEAIYALDYALKKSEKLRIAFDEVE